MSQASYFMPRCPCSPSGSRPKTDTLIRNADVAARKPPFIVSFNHAQIPSRVVDLLPQGLVPFLVVGSRHKHSRLSPNMKSYFLKVSEKFIYIFFPEVLSTLLTPLFFGAVQLKSIALPQSLLKTFENFNVRYSSINSRAALLTLSESNSFFDTHWRSIDTYQFPQKLQYVSMNSKLQIAKKMKPDFSFFE